MPPSHFTRQSKAASPIKRRSHWTNILLAGACVITLGTTAILTSGAATPSPAIKAAVPVASSPPRGVSGIAEPTSLEELKNWPADGLGNLDIALTNLLCAEGLPGSESIDIRKIRSTLDRWALAVAVETQRYAERFHHHPEEFQN